MIEAIVAVAAAYLLGSINGSLVLGRLRGVDIRTLGSGNAGGTNALRTQGRGFALGVVLIDVAKGWVAVRWIAQLDLLGLAPVRDPAWLAVACGFAAVIGHVYPIWHGFRGGKGGATLLGALIGLAPVLLLVVLGAWLICAAAFGFVGLATIVAAASLPIAVLLTGIEPREPLLAFGIAAAALVAYAHRGNIARMRARREPRLRLPWLSRS